MKVHKGFALWSGKWKKTGNKLKQKDGRTDRP